MGTANPSAAAIPGAATAPTWPAGSSGVATAPADLPSFWPHVASRTPVVLVPPEEGNAAAASAAAAAAAAHLRALTPAALAAAAGEVPVAVETRPGPHASFGRGTTVTMPFATALARLAGGAGEGGLYLSAQAPRRPATGNLPLPLGDLALALAGPSAGAPAGLIPVHHPLAGGLILAAMNLWVGGDAAGSGLHADAHDNLLGLVAGTKAVTLFPPAVVGALATVGTPVRVWPNGRLVFAGPGAGAGADGACGAALREAAARAAQRAAAAAAAGGGTDDEEEAALAAALEEDEEGGAAGLDDYDDEEEEEEAAAEEKGPGASAAAAAAATTTPPTFSRADLSDPASVRKAFPAFPWSAGRTVTLTPGQTLYIPAGWFHYVQSAPEKRGAPSPPSSPPSPWAGLHCAVNHWFHPPDAAAGEGGPAAPYSRPYWAGVWAEAVEACPRLRAAVEAQRERGSAPPPLQPPPPPLSPPLTPQPGRPATVAPDTASLDAARALLKSGLDGLAAFDAGGRGQLRLRRRAAVLAALAGRRTRHGAGCVLPWVKKRRRGW